MNFYINISTNHIHIQCMFSKHYNIQNIKLRETNYTKLYNLHGPLPPLVLSESMRLSQLRIPFVHDDLLIRNIFNKLNKKVSILRYIYYTFVFFDVQYILVLRLAI